MTLKAKPLTAIMAVVALAVALSPAPVGDWGLSFVAEAAAQDSGEKTPAAWYPRTEKVGPDEMFIVALGTGMPTPITRAQKSSAWYVELGNGDIFLFDIGSGSMENLFAMRPEFHRVDKVFASHLHAAAHLRALRLEA